LEKQGWRKVATGSWLYDGVVPKPISVWSKPAHLSSSRFDEDDQLDDTKPIPETLDGLLYCCRPGGRGEFLTVEEAEAGADAQPWGPVKWD
jgi:hypothetical protein